MKGTVSPLRLSFWVEHSIHPNWYDEYFIGCEVNCPVFVLAKFLWHTEEKNNLIMLSIGRDIFYCVCVCVCVSESYIHGIAILAGTVTANHTPS